MSIRILLGDVRERLWDLPDESVHCVVTSPPYWGLRDYGVPGQIGLEPTPEKHVETMVGIFREVRRVLRRDGTLWLNYGDSYGGPAGNNRSGLGNPKDQGGTAIHSGRKAAAPGTRGKDLVGMPWRVAFGLQTDGWYLRSDIIWHKPNPMPESVTDRPTKSHEYVFLLSRSARYYYDADAVREAADYGYSPTRGDMYGSVGGTHSASTTTPGSGGTRNLRSVWTIATEAFPGSHFATFPTKLVEPCIKAGCPVGGTVLDPFGGAGTTGLVADRLGRNAVLIELNPEYAEMARLRLRRDCPMFTEVSVDQAMTHDATRT